MNIRWILVLPMMLLQRVVYAAEGITSQANIMLLSLCVLTVTCLVLAFAYFKARRQVMQGQSAIRDSLKENFSLKEEDLEKIPSHFSDAMTVFVNSIEKQLLVTREKKEDALTQNKVLIYQHKKLQSVLELFPEGIVVLDESGMATYVNGKLNTMLGIESEKVIGKLPHDWSDNDQLIALLARYDGNVTRLRRSETVEFSPSDQPGKTIAASVLPLTLPNQPGVTIGVLVVFRDISAEVMARHSRDDFVAHVSHELKSPLNVIKMHGELLQEIGDNEQQRVTSLNVINDEIERISKMISNLLDITRFEVGSMAITRQRTKIREFLVDVFDTMKRLSKDEDIHFESDIPRALSNISIDKDLMRVAMNNLLSNAVKYNQPGGTVTLEVIEQDDNILIKVSDTGIGIAEVDQTHVFEKFYRSDDDQVTDRNGHGLGLSLAHEIITLHNGRLTLESAPGQGSTFTIELAKTSTLLKEAV